MNRYPLSQQQFETLKAANWQIHELPRSEWDHVPNLPRRADTVAIFYSGCMNQPKLLNGIASVGGIDIVAQETRPQAGEPELNVYHAVIQQLDAGKNPMPFLLHAPFRDETLFGHWGGYEMLQRYIDASLASAAANAKVTGATDVQA